MAVFEEATVESVFSVGIWIEALFKDLANSSKTVYTPALKKDVYKEGALYIYHHFYPSFLVCVLFDTPFPHLFLFLMIFLSCLIYNNGI